MIDDNEKQKSGTSEKKNTELTRFEAGFGRQFLGKSARPVNPATLDSLGLLEEKP